MSPSPKSNAESQRLELIVSYLDGELPAEQSAQVEQKLAKDEQFRQELQGLDLAWSALDQLPTPTVDDRFSKTTMELVVNDAERELQRRTIALPKMRRKRSLSTALSLGTFVLLGILVFRVVVNNPNRQLLADLPAIQNINLYSDIEDIAFLSALEKEVDATLWTPEVKAEEIEAQVATFKRISNASERSGFIAQLSSEEKASLRVKFNRFQDLNESQQDRLRNLHNEIAEMRNEQLATLVRYHQWLKSMPAAEQYELRKTSDPSRRAQLVASLLESQRRDEVMHLTDEELKKLVDVVTEYAFKVYDSKAEKLTHQERKRMDKAGQLAQISFVIRNMDPLERFNLYRKLSHSLPEDTRQVLLERPKADRPMIVLDFLQQARMRLGPQGLNTEVTEEQLETFFVEELSLSEQETLLALPRDQMLTRLKQMYRGNAVNSFNLPHEFWHEGPFPGDRPMGPEFHRPRRPGDRPHGPRRRDGFGREGGPPLGPPRDDRGRSPKRSPFNQSGPPPRNP